MQKAKSEVGFSMTGLACATAGVNRVAASSIAGKRHSLVGGGINDSRATLI
jgi:hypothetical protein